MITVVMERLADQGESETLEFKRSTGALLEAMQTLCAFANGSGGTVLIGVPSDGKIIGQQVTGETLRDIAASRDRFEPPIGVAIERIEVAISRAVLVLIVAGTSDAAPCTYDGRAFERAGNATRLR